MRQRPLVFQHLRQVALVGYAVSARRQTNKHALTTLEATLLGTSNDG
jgi:hypothetical protein